jgi:hypothetical protein
MCKDWIFEESGGNRISYAGRNKKRLRERWMGQASAQGIMVQVVSGSCEANWRRHHRQLYQQLFPLKTICPDLAPRSEPPP